MMHGGVRKPAISHGGVHVSVLCQPCATSPVHPAAMHGGVMCICPAMHGGGAKRPSFEIFFVNGLNLKFVLKMG